ncbi:LysR substrate-binding domain-containing protein, partial [Rhizobium johnstonii]|uniref:LysR substrate-binding domain-containing protein n=1 Tax=Rhizobium johnstonii TaxID=3019933 RepID=UPI003F9AEC1E
MSGRLRLSAPTTLGIKRLAPVMAELAERHPALSVELNRSASPLSISMLPRTPTVKLSPSFVSNGHSSRGTRLRLRMQRPRRRSSG